MTRPLYEILNAYGVFNLLSSGNYFKLKRKFIFVINDSSLMVPYPYNCINKHPLGDFVRFEHTQRSMC